ncbi:two-component response regulator ARR10-like isoform X2 [Diospyros lotus]|uniref:two-component response regulator ARR10-like isoform X2 n=1 Tax=Diospyros lotus TaxID=55363 RepID=UPI002253D140|nr:two-component response regulator ARR10-like isoform X2 [Diospyros lotus]
MKAGSIDLVLTDVHMSDMNGFELQKQIQEEFKLPVVFMSADDKDAIILKALESGAALFIVKPITPSDLKNLWQFAVASRKGKTVTEESGSAQEAHQIAKAGNQAIRFQEATQVHKFSIQEMEHASSPIEYMLSMKDSGKKAIVMDTNAEEGDGNNFFAGPRKPRFIWTNEVHSQFVEAVKAMGGPENAVPNKLVKLMNVPGLTREQVASHLQKYRSYQRQVFESNTQARPISERSKIEKTYRSTFARMQPVPLWRRQLQSQNLEQGNMIPSLQHTYSESYVPTEAPRLGDDPPYLFQKVSPSNSSYNYLNKPIPGSAFNMPYTSRIELNNYQNNLLLAGNTSASLFSGTKFTQMGHQKEHISTASGDINSSDSDYTELTTAEASTYLDFSSGVMNEIQYESISPVPTLSGNSGDGHLGRGVSSSIGVQITNNVSPSLSSIQQENASMPPLSNVSDLGGITFDQHCGEDVIDFSFLDEIGTEVNPFQQGIEEALNFNNMDNLEVNYQSLQQQPAGGEAHSLSDEHFLPSNQSPRQIN